MAGNLLYGNLLKALDTDLWLTAGAVTIAFVLAVITRWARELGFLAQALMVCVAGFAGTISLFTGNLTWAFYVDGADPFRSVAHPAVRLTYLFGGCLFAAGMLAVPLTGRFIYRGDSRERVALVYGRLLGGIVLLNLLFVLAMVGADVAAWVP